MTLHRRIILPCLFAFAITWRSVGAESASEAITRATTAVKAAEPRAQADPAHPTFHVTAPAQWINDPNGPIYYRGNYHLFYQLHPFSDGSGPKYWGHVRSRDLVKWEHLPIAIAPSMDLGESEIWSGCCTINGAGEPMIFYTSIAPGRSAQTHAEQWAAIGDEDLIRWRKSPLNPVLSETVHEGKKIYEWRDPFIFHEGRQTFLVTGGNLNETKGGQAVVNIYEAQNLQLTQWRYRGVLFQIPDAKARTAECPNFFKLGDRWVLFVSPYGKVQYYAGTFDSQTCRFHAQNQGLLDLGPNFYAPNTMLVPDGRRIVWGWINGFPNGRGWNGSLSLPRLLSWSRDGQLSQNPAPQLEHLRGKSIVWRNMRLEAGEQPLALPNTNTLEILGRIDLATADVLSLTISGKAATSRPVTIEIGRPPAAKTQADLSLSLDRNDRKLNLRVFIDRSVIEVFANGTLCATKVVAPIEPGSTLSLQARGGAAKAKRIECWPMKTIW